MATVAATRARTPLVLRLLAIPATVVVVLVGLWVVGGKLTNDFRLAMVLSGGWMALAGVVALAIAVRSRPFRWPVLAAYAATAAAAGAYLGASVLMDDVVNERVATASTTPAVSGQTSAPARRDNNLLRSGRFESVRHEARGDVKAIELAKGGRVLTLTNFEVDNGPDLRVYLVAGA
ncbi:MAG: DM13 domain-containing protein, partial [Actinomycetota bacterium]|nr:DM13 domain-containing protein [Actinomycetota bacterium]